MKLQFSTSIKPPRAGWFMVYYADTATFSRRFFDGNVWRKGAYPDFREYIAKGVTRAGNSWSYWFQK